jgi:CRP-like cAMP-binding protein
MPSADDYLARKLTCFVKLSTVELAGLAELQSAPFDVTRGKELLRQGEAGQAAYILHSGWGCSFKILRDGGRQVITFPIPGDMIGVRSILLKTSDHAFSAITDAQVSRISVSRLNTLIDEFPRLSTAIMWATSRDEAVTVEHLASVGRRTALERTAHFFLELRDRLQLVGLSSDSEYECPLSQYSIADALGLSSIHVNRVLRQLRELELLTFQDHSVTLHNAAGLAELSGYDNIEEH